MKTHCLDCKTAPATVRYVSGDARCESCAQVKLHALYELRKAEYMRRRIALAAHEAAGCPDDGIFCLRCCDHQDRENGHCIDCGHERYA